VHDEKVTSTQPRSASAGGGDHTAAPRPEVASRAYGWAWLAGVVAGLAGLAIAELLSWLLFPLGSPLSAVGEWVIAIAPAAVINFGKEVLGFADKPILLGVVGMVALAVAAVSGRLEYSRRGWGAIGPALLAVISLAAIAQRPDAGFGAFVPVLVGLLVAYLLLRLLITQLMAWDPRRSQPVQNNQVSARRTFLITAGVIGGLSLVAGGLARARSGAASVARQAREMVTLPLPETTAAPVPSGADFKINELTPYVTDNATFYRIDTALQVPVVDPADWSLTITGMVEQEVTISFDELLAMPLTEHYVTLTCVSNEVGGNLAGNARWLGFPIRDLLKRAGPQPGADMVLSRSVDGFTAGTPLEVLTDPDREAIVAVGMNGEPLPADHGFPARLVVPGLYGYVSATKWVTELKVTTFADDRGYWTPLGWSARGPIKVASRIDTPTRSVQAGPVAVAGVAWAQHTGIERVEVRVDQGPWREAKLADTVGPDTWRQWMWEWEAEPGDHVLTVRATDTEGTTQTSVEAPPAPNGATGWHSVTLSVD
jgi:DMSO/TMAO reductase YedYZ molybdopterin-dependent catalytic subunit